MDDDELLAELRAIFDRMPMRDRESGLRDLENAAAECLAAVARWQLARAAGRVLAQLEKPGNHRNH